MIKQSPRKHVFVNKKYTLLHQNIAGILGKIDFFEITLQNFLCNNNSNIESIDIICLTETFIKRGSESNLRLSNYKLASSYSRTHQKRGGTCIIVKNNLDYTALDTHKYVIPTEKHFEYCGIKIISLNIIIICIYRTPDSDIEFFFHSLDALLTKLNVIKPNIKIILCGDWNINILNTTKCTERLRSILTNYNLFLHIQKPTRKSTCIDLIVSNFINTSPGIHYMALSDHETSQTLTFELPISKNTLPKYRTVWFERRRDFSKSNLHKFKQCIAALSFQEVMMETDTNKAFKIFHEDLICFFNLCFPIITVKMFSKNVNNKWITKGIRKSCINKRILYLKYRYSPTNKCTKKKQYDKYTKLLKRIIEKSQSICNNKFICNSKNKGKAAWDIINSNVGAIKSEKEIKEIKCSANDLLLTDPISIANEFNNYFINISKNKTQINENNSIVLIPNHINTLFITPITPIDVYKVIINLKNTNSVGYDDINTKILKLCAGELSLPLSHIINLSFTSGVFPSDLKLTVIKPIHKKGDKSSLNNYRPIALIPIISKIFEKFMSDKIYTFLTKYNLLNSEQFGFRKNSNTTLACLKLNKSIIEALNAKFAIIGIFLDMTKAFDLVCHETLIRKLERYGLRGPVLQWIASYLGHRQQCVEITQTYKEHRSTFRSAFKQQKPFGVPQGSILGPLLFLTYINDLPNNIDHQCILYADDTTILIKCKDKSILESETNNTLSKTIEWLELNNLSVNMEKTKYIQFLTYNSYPFNLQISHKMQIIKKAEDISFLGLIFDEYSNWKAHIDRLCDKLDRFTYVLKRLSRNSSIKTALLAYHGHVASLLRYGIVLWGNSVNAEKVFIRQKACLRSICGANMMDSCRPLFKCHGILPLPSLYILEICLLLKKYPGLFNTSNENLVNPNMKGRRRNKIPLPQARISLFTKSAYYMAIKIYNKLPETIKSTPHLPPFKRKLYDLLLNKMYYKINDYLMDNSI